MRIRLGPMVAASVLALSLAAPVSAQTSEWFKLTSAGSTIANGVNVGPYQAMELGSGALPAASGPTIDIYCVDYFGHASVGQLFDAFVTPLDQNLDGRSNGGNAKQIQYLQAAWLTQQFASQPKGAGNQNWFDIHATIWNLLNSASPDPSSNYWLQQAQLHYTSITPGNFAVVHSFNPEAYQEFLITTPEPVTSTLLLGGLLGMGAGYLRRRRGQTEA